jgi:hypothetical protein
MAYDPINPPKFAIELSKAMPEAEPYPVRNSFGSDQNASDIARSRRPDGPPTLRTKSC